MPVVMISYASGSRLLGINPSAPAMASGASLVDSSAYPSAARLSVNIANGAGEEDREGVIRLLELAATKLRAVVRVEDHGMGADTGACQVDRNTDKRNSHEGSCSGVGDWQRLGDTLSELVGRLETRANEARENKKPLGLSPSSSSPSSLPLPSPESLLSVASAVERIANLKQEAADAYVMAAVQETQDRSAALLMQVGLQIDR